MAPKMAQKKTLGGSYKTRWNGLFVVVIRQEVVVSPLYLESNITFLRSNSDYL